MWMLFCYNESMEIWKDVPDVLNYEASNRGRIRHKKHKRILKVQTYNGYRTLPLDSTKGRITIRLGRLVGRLFNDDYDENMQVDHINGDKSDDRAENLRFVTPKQNSQHRDKLAKHPCRICCPKPHTL